MGNPNNRKVGFRSKKGREGGMRIGHIVREIKREEKSYREAGLKTQKRT